MVLFSTEIFGFTVAPSFYGLMYGISFIIGYLLLRRSRVFSIQELDTLFMYIFFWVIVWGRIWYVLLYKPWYYFSHPLEIFQVWNGWMSFHWWVIGVTIAMILFAKKTWLNPYMVFDQVARVVPIWLCLGRIANYMNKELLGFVYNWPLAVVTNAGSFFPSPLLEAFLEWIVLFLILNTAYKRPHAEWQIACLFLIWYGVFRIFVEVFFRMPDAHIGYILPYTSIGTLLSITMIFVWVYFYTRLGKKI